MSKDREDRCRGCEKLATCDRELGRKEAEVSKLLVECEKDRARVERKKRELVRLRAVAMRHLAVIEQRQSELAQRGRGGTTEERAEIERWGLKLARARGKAMEVLGEIQEVEGQLAGMVGSGGERRQQIEDLSLRIRQWRLELRLEEARRVFAILKTPAPWVRFVPLYVLVCCGCVGYANALISLGVFRAGSGPQHAFFWVLTLVMAAGTFLAFDRWVKERARSGPSGAGGDKIVVTRAAYVAALQEVVERAPGASAAKLLNSADSVFNALSAVLPKRICDEEIGDALEDIHRRLKAGRPHWEVRLKVWSTVVWVLLHAGLEFVIKLGSAARATTGGGDDK